MNPVCRDDLQVRQLGGEFVVLDRNNGLVHQLNEVAGFILSQCDGKTSTESIVSALVETYAVDEELARRDVDYAIAKFNELDLLLKSPF